MLESQNRSRFFIPTLDGWRAISILAVMTYHASYYFFYHDGIHPDEHWHQIFKLGAFGVHIFFGISGLLITSRMLEEAHIYGNLSLKEFYIRRAFRILPIYLTYIAFIFLLGLIVSTRVPSEEFLSSTFFFRNYREYDSWYLGHFWSLSFEEHFYIFWPLLFSLIPTRRYLAIVLSLIGLIIIWRFFDYRFQWLAPYLQGVNPRSRTDLFLDYIFWGAVSAYLLQSVTWRARLQKYTRAWMWPLFLALFIAIFFIRIPQVDFFRTILIQLMLLSSILNPHTSWTWILENRFFSWVGRLSYSLYIWQQFFFPRQDFIIKELSTIQQLPVSIAGVFAVSYFCHRFIEKPCIKIGKKLTTRHF